VALASVVSTAQFPVSTGVVPPPLPPSEVARPPLVEARPEPREDPRVAIRYAVDEALAPLQQTVRELQRRIEELERRPAQVISQVVGSPSATSAGAGSATAARPVEAHRAAHSAAASPSIPVAVSLAPRAPVLDIKAIERDTNIVVDGALDGSRRKRRLALTFAFFLIVIFGGLFAALAYSYQPH
jgi:hypothetical protein